MEKKLVELVKMNPLLYDKSHKFAKRTELREQTWIRIAKELGLERVEVQKRWKTLRDRFYRERKAMCARSEIKAPRSTAKKKWKHYDIMQFLLNMPATENPLQTGEVQEKSAASFLKEFSTKLEIDDEGNFLFEEKFNCNQDNNEVSVPYGEPIPGPSNVSDPVPVARRQQRRKTLPEHALLSKTHEQMNKLLQSAKKIIEGVTPVTAFFNSMALLVEANNLNFERLSSLQVRLTNIVHEEIRKQREEDTVIQGI